jgi:hypothetical protein
MKFCFTLFAGFLFAAATAQSFTVSTNYVTLGGDVTSSSIPSAAWTPTITNTSGDTLNLRWVRVEENIPNYWRSSVCTEYFCSNIPDDSLSWTLLPGDVDMTYIHIYPYGFADTGNVVLKIFNVDNPSDSVRVTYHADVTTGIAEHSAVSFIHADVFSHSVKFSPAVQGVWTLCDVTGNLIVQEKTVPGETYSADVPVAGVYFFTFVNDEGFAEVHKLIL